MKRLGITARLLLISIGVFVGFGAAVTGYSLVQLRRILYQEMIRRVEAQALNWIEANLAQITISRDAGALARLVGELRQREGIAYVVLLDEAGGALAQSGPAAAAGIAPVEQVAGVKSSVRRIRPPGGPGFFELETPVSTSGTGMSRELEALFGAAAATETLGSLRVGIEEGALDRAMRGLVVQTVALYALLVLLALALHSSLARRMVAPITALAGAATRISAGDLAARATEGVARQDEVGDLVRSFNQMAERLAGLYAGLEEKVRERTRELEQANRQLKELDRLKSHFLSTVSHELQSPLTSIKNAAGILLDEPEPELDARRRFLEIIDGETDRLRRLIGDLLDLARIEAGAMVWRFGPTDLAEVVRAAATTLVAVAAEKAVRLEISQAGAQPVRADADRLQQVVMNLVSNAIKFSPPGGSVAVRLEPADGGFRVAVQDHGPGIPPEDRERVFERFYQGSQHRPGQGAGLGLAISREIVAHHGGKIWVESEGPGSTFYFTIPAGQDT